MKLAPEEHQKLKNQLANMRLEREHWWAAWRELADYYLPRRYVALLSPKERTQKLMRNPYILDATGTTAAKTLASGMMNGITSPARPWFKLGIPGIDEELSDAARKWLNSVERAMMRVMAESNFYNALAVMYLDLVIFGTASFIIYEDRESYIRCYNPALGEYYLGQSNRLQVNQFAREITLKVGQMVEQFGEENLSDQLQAKVKLGGANLHHDVKIVHMILPHNYAKRVVAKQFPYYECYWEMDGPAGQFLLLKGFNEFPVIAPRWDTTANDVYGTSLAMEAFGDVVQLQHETKKKGQALDKMNDPPMLADAMLENKPIALLPKGITYIAGLNNDRVGARPAYQIQFPISELTLDIRDVQTRIREIFHNDLFRMISQLDTVRSATEIDARREEKLVLLGPVLERFETEALDPAIARIFAIMDRAGLIPEPPDDIAGVHLETQYVSILSSAQRAVGTVPVERWLTLIGGLAGSVYPKAANIPDYNELVRGYGRDIGVPAAYVRDSDEVDQENQLSDEVQAAREAAAVGEPLAAGAKTLSETQVGGGASALDAILGG